MNEPRVIVAGSLIDGSGADVRKNVFLAMKDGVITAIGPKADRPNNDKAAIDDFSHCTVLPALVDCSVSLSQSPSLDKTMQLSSEKDDPAGKAAMVERHIRYCHAYGVLGVADSGDICSLVELDPNTITQWGVIDICSSVHLKRSGQDSPAVNQPERDFLKIAYSGNIESEQSLSLQLNYEYLSRILQQKGDKKAVVVANGRQQVREALDAGCDAIEQGYAMGEDNLRIMAEKNVLWIPCALRAKNALDSAGSSGDVCCRFSHRYVAPGKPVPGAEAFWKKIVNEQLAQLRFARELGVTTAVGTGAGSTGILHGESIVEEMKLFIKCGYSLEETIRCASENGARFFGMEKLGALAVGRQATFLLTRGSPKQLPRKLSYLEGIYVNGVPCTYYRKTPFKAV